MDKRTLKEISLELLGFYEEMEKDVIDDISYRFTEDEYEEQLQHHFDIIERYKQEIENAEA